MPSRRPIFTVAVLIAMLTLAITTGAIAAQSATAAGATSRPTTVIAPADCVTSDCHATVKASPVVHGPVAVDACDACHELTDAEKHTYKTSRESAELCTYCHEFSVAAMPVVHKPVTLGQCLGCHDPHGGKTHSLTRENSTPELCGRCHESITRGKSFLHGPVNQGACLSCHPPHAARFPKLLDVVGADLCLTCHAEFENRMVRVKFTHRALDEGCQKCHDPHGSASPNSTTQPVEQQCTGCHAPIEQRAATAKVQHSIVRSGRSCLNCHTPHGSDVAKLMSDVPANVCLSCHKEAINSEKTATASTVSTVSMASTKPTAAPAVAAVAAMSALADPALARHGAIKDGQCSGCHEAHGADGANLLNKANSRAFYQRFSPQQYELCFSCHDSRLATAEKIGGVTRFRDGERNLHYVHVAVGKRSHSCFVCHDPHVAGNANLLRERMAYGIWQLPMRFRPSATGGTCSPGCHNPYSYDREHPVGPTTRPIDPAAPMVIRADEEPPARLSIILKDVRGRDVVVPDAECASVVVFLGSDETQNDELLQALELSLRKLPTARLVLIACGQGAPTVAAALVERMGDERAVIADPTGTLCDQLSIRAWPTTVVVRADGSILARIGGTPEVLAMKLSQYLGQPSDPVSPRVLSDTTRTRASRDLQVARMLLRQGKPDEALKVLVSGIEAQRDSVAHHALAVEVLAELKRTDEAMSLLDQIPADALSGSAREVLRGRVYMCAGKWDLAEAALQAAIAADPAATEAHYLLGKLYEQKGDWQRAAEAYRHSRQAEQNVDSP